MTIEIQHTDLNDAGVIFVLYEEAIAYQKKVGNNHWLGFDPALIEKEIEEHRHYKIIAEREIVGTFCITLSDPLIWKDSDITAAVYIHRISTRQSFHGNNLLKHILDWARQFSKEHKLAYIRLDTGSGNDRLINYYKKWGFTFLGDAAVDYAPDLPAHYKEGTFALFQLPVE